MIRPHAQDTMIIAPFWGNPKHVGNFRIDRFVRWLNRVGQRIIMVRAGNRDERKEAPFGVEITIRDPLGLYGDRADGGFRLPTRRPNRFRRQLAHLLFCPDPSIVWAKRAANHPMVIAAGKTLKRVISSNPPESAHVAAGTIARHASADLIIDMRDGWLDDPLKWPLKRLRFQKWREGRIEKRLLIQATRIFVTSEVWLEMLIDRFPRFKNKVHVITNTYPPIPRTRKSPKSNQERKDRIKLIHTGRFRGSRPTQNPSTLLRPLCRGDLWKQPGEIWFVGDLTLEDRAEIESWRESFSERGWSFQFHSHMDKERLVEAIDDSNGTLLLSATSAPLPSKIFDYLYAAKPILAVTPGAGAVDRLARTIPLIYQIEIAGSTDSLEPIRRFRDHCLNGNKTTNVPKEFSEEYVSDIFLHGVGIR